MNVIKLILLTCLLTAVVHAQTKRDQPPESNKNQTGKNTWEQREAQIKALKKELAQNPKSAEAHYALAKAYLRDPVLRVPMQSSIFNKLWF